MIFSSSRTLKPLCFAAMIFAIGSLHAANYTNTIANGGTIASGDNAIVTNPMTSITGDILNNGSLQFLQSGTLTDTNLISGTGFITQSGSGTTIFGSANTYSGGTGIGSGVLSVSKLADGSSSSIGTSYLALYGGTLSYTGLGSETTTRALWLDSTNSSGVGGGTFNIANAGASLTWNPSTGSIIYGVTKTGAGTFTLGGVMSGSSPLTVNGGTMNLRAANTSTGAVTVNAGTLNVTGSGQLFSSINGPKANAVTVQNGGELQIGNWDWTGSLGTLNYEASALNLNGGTLTYLGTTANGYAARGFTVGTNGATFNAGSYGQSWVLGRASGNYLAVFNGSSTLTGVGNGQMDQYITGSGGLTKNGSGTWSLNGTNTYTGGTTVNAGTLAILQARGITNNLVINSGGTVLLDGQDNALWSVTTNTINSGGVLTQNASNATHMNAIVLNGGTIAAQGAPTGSALYWGSYLLDRGVTTIGSSNTSVISAQNVALTQVGGTIFNIASGATNGVDLLFSGSIGAPVGGAGYMTSLIKSGNGVMQLAGNNTYTNATTISAGTLLVSGRLGGGNYTSAITDNASLVMSNSATQTLGGTISGSGSFTQAGAGTTILSSANTFSGGTFVNAGTLILSNAASAYGAGIGAIRGNLTVNSGAAVQALTTSNGWALGWIGATNAVSSVLINGGTLSFSNTSYCDAGTVATNITLNGGTINNLGSNNGYYGSNFFGWYYAQTSSPTLTVLSNPVSSVIGTGINIRLNGANNNVAFNVASGATNGTDLLVTGPIFNAGSGDGLGGIVKTGTGTMRVNGNASYTGGTTVNAGSLTFNGTNTFAGGNIRVGGAGGASTLTFAGGPSTAASTAYLYAGTASGDRAVVNVATNLSIGNVNLGASSGASGALNISGGTFSQSGGPAWWAFMVGATNGGYGSVRMTGGALNVSELGIGGAVGGNGSFDLLGGTMTVSNWFTLNRADASFPGNIAAMNISGGTLNASTAGNGLGWGGGGYGVINVGSGGTANFGTNALRLAFYGNNNPTNIVTVGTGGVLQSGGVTMNGSAAGGSAILNFNGGTLKAGASSGTFLQGLSGVYVGGGGGALDNNGNNITVAQNLLTPTGSGLASITLSNGGSGYIGSPVVQISGGGGSGATAIAQIDTNTGSITNILVTSAGSGYTSAPTITLVGGGASSAASGISVSTNTASSGGLTFNGSAVTTLSGNNTFGGGITVTGGTLQFTSDAQLGNATNGITLNGGQLYNNNSVPTIAASRTITLGSNGGYLMSGWNANSTYLSPITGSGSLGIAWDSGTVTLAGSNSYTGTTTIGTTNAPYWWNSVWANPTLKLANSNALTGGGALVFGTSPSSNTATLDLGGYNASVAGLSGTNNAILTNTTGTLSTLTLAPANSAAFGGKIGGNIALVKNGSGTETLSGQNTYSGGTIVNAGTLSLTTNNALLNNASNGITINNGGIASFAAQNVITTSGYTVSNVITVNTGGTLLNSGNSYNMLGAVNLNGGTINSAGTNTLNGIGFELGGPVTVNGGTNTSVIAGSGIGLSSATNLTTVFNVSSGGTASGIDLLVTGQLVNGSTTNWPTNVVSSLTKTGSGVMMLSNNNTYSGATLVSGGTLMMGVNNAISTNSVVTLTNGGTLNLNGTIQSIQGIQINGSSMIQTNGSFTTLAGGDGVFAIGSAPGTASSYTLGGGTVTLANAGNLQVGQYGNGTFTQTGGAVNSGSWTVIARYAGSTGVYNISGGSLTETNLSTRLIVGESGSGTMTVSGSASVTALGGVSLAWGGGNGVLNLNGGTLTTPSIVGAAYGGSGTQTLNLNGGTIVATASTNNFIGGLTAAHILSNGVTVNDSGYALTIGQSFDGAGGVTKTGGGTLTLSSSNSFTGTTTISGGGAIALASTGTLSGSTNINLGTTNSRGMLDLSAKGASGYTFGSNQTLSGNGTVTTGATNRTVTVNGTLNPGNSIGTLAVNGNLTLGSTARSIFELGTAGTFASPGLSDRTTVTGNLALGGSLSLLDNANQNGQGVMGPGVYRLFTYGGSLSGSFTNTPPSLIYNSALYRPSLVTATLGVVDLNIAQLASGSFFTNAISLVYHVTNSGSVSTTLGISNTVAAGGGSLGVSLVSNSGGASITGATNFSNLAPSSSTNMVLSVAKSATAGVTSGTAVFAMNDTGVGGGSTPVSLGSNAITYTATGYNLASGTFDSTNIDLGRIHAGGTFGTTNLVMGNRASVSPYTETLGASFGSGSGGVLGSGSLTGLASGSSDTSLSVTITNTTAGAKSGAVAVNLLSEAINNSGLGNTSLGSQAVNVMGFVYSGQGVWNTNGGSWSSFGNWQQAGGVAGIDGALSANDTATFGFSGSGSVTLDGTSPTLQSLTFSNSSGSYTLAQGSGGTLTLTAGNTNASITVQAGSHDITAPLTFGSDVTVTGSSNTALTLGSISGVGGLTLNGFGSLTLTASNTYTGLTKVNGGTLALNGSISGNLQVDAGGTLKGSGAVAGDAVIAGTHAIGTPTGIQNFGGNLTYQPGASVVWQLSANTTSNNPVIYNQLIVGGNLSFNGATTIVLSFADMGSLVNWNDQLWSDYIKTTDGWLIYQVNGTVAGLENVTISGSLLDGTGTSLLSAHPDASFNLYQDGNNVYLNYSVPEPSTYALIGLGVMALVTALRRRRSA